MKKFLILSGIFTVLLLISFYMVFLAADGFTDPYYLRFTTPRQTSLILGTSRAAQAMQPQVLNQVLSRNDIYNYSFTIGHSPYGPTYLKSIKRKLSMDSKNGIFILAVDPWCFSSNSKDPNDSTQFEELGLALSDIYLVNIKPNIPYLLKYYDKSFWNLIASPDSTMRVHNDGWFEVSVPMDSASLKQRTENKIEEYKNIWLPQYKASEIRLEYTIKTINYLRNYGTVYLVRLPIHPLMMEMDQALMPDFNDKMERIVEQTGVEYLDLAEQNPDYTYIDGNHLHKESGKKVSEIIAKWILEKNKSIHFGNLTHKQALMH